MSNPTQRASRPVVVHRSTCAVHKCSFCLKLLSRALARNLPKT